MPVHRLTINHYKEAHLLQTDRSADLKVNLFSDSVVVFLQRSATRTYKVFLATSHVC